MLHGNNRGIIERRRLHDYAQSPHGPLNISKRAAGYIRTKEIRGRDASV
jgi:hypothetical protein